MCILTPRNIQILVEFGPIFNKKSKEIEQIPKIDF